MDAEQRQRPGGVPGDGSSLIDRTRQRLLVAIVVGEFLPGEGLPAERDLAVALGVGRTTVRAAMETLVGRGVLEKRRGRLGGAFVRETWPDDSVAAVRHWFDERWPDLVDAAEASAVLHGAVARLAAARRTETDLERIRSALAAFRAAGSGAPKQRADADLHLGIIEAAGNASLQAMLLQHERTLSIVAPAHPWGAADDHAAMERRAERDHVALVDAIAAGDAELAGAIAQEHLHIDLDMLAAARERVLAWRAA